MEEQVHVSGSPFTMFDAVEDFLHPPGALAARSALPAGLVVVELREDIRRLHDAHTIVEHYHAGQSRPWSQLVAENWRHR